MKRIRTLGGRQRERVDPFEVSGPWRHHVQSALQAKARYDQALGGLAAGPLRESLEEIGGRVDAATRECWRIAQQGDALDDAASTLGLTLLRRRLAARTETTAPGEAEDPVAASLRAQLDAAEGVTASVSGARERLALLEARLGEAVAAAVALSAQAGEADTAPLRHDVDLVVEGLAALRSALEETRTPSEAVSSDHYVDPMSFTGGQEPPRNVWLTLDEALELLGVLEDARDVLTDSGHLAVVVDLETQLRELARRLDFDDPEGDASAH